MIAAKRNRATVCRLLLDAFADPSLIDCDGRSALDLALSAGAADAVAVLSNATVSNEPKAANATEVDAPSQPEPPSLDVVPTAPAARSTTLSSSPTSGVAERVLRVFVWDDGDEHTVPVDFSGWIAEEVRQPPTGAVSSLKFDDLLQASIAAFVPIDSSADWTATEARLPAQAARPAQPGEEEAHLALRLLLLRALREGSVPEQLIQDFATDHGELPDQNVMRALLTTLADMGAESDERQERVLREDDFRVFLSKGETELEEDSLRDALDHFDSLAADQNVPLQLYYKRINREPLISADDERSFAQAMESAARSGLDALAGWPRGVEALIEAIGRAADGSVRVVSIAALSDEEEPTIQDGEEQLEPLVAAENEGLPDESPQFETATFFAKARALAMLPRPQSACGDAWRILRRAIGELGLRQSFLAGFAQDARSDAHPAAVAFHEAIDAHRRARDQMAVANLKLVRSIATRYAFHSGLVVDDLIQEGNIGLLKAVEKFDWRKGFKFSTYASWWIRQAVTRSIGNDSRMIRLPVHVHEQAMKLERASEAFRLINFRDPTYEELASKVPLSVEKIAAYLLRGQPLVSLHEENVEAQFSVDYVLEATVTDPSETVAAKELSLLLNKLISDLGRKPEQILRARFGLDAGAPSTLEEIGDRMGLTRERIRQIEAEAIRKLKDPARSDVLAPWSTTRRESSPARAGHGVEAIEIAERLRSENEYSPTNKSPVGTSIDQELEPQARFVHRDGDQAA